MRLSAQANQLAPAQVIRALDLLADAQVRIRTGGADPRLQLELVAAKLARPALDADVAAIVPRLEVLERTGASSATIAPAPAAKVTAPAAAPSPEGPDVTRRRRRSRAGAGAPTPPPPPTPPSAVFDLPHVQRLWPQVLRELQTSHPPLYTFIEDGRPTAAADGVLEMSLASSVGATMLSKADQRAEFEQVLRSVFGSASG